MKIGIGSFLQESHSFSPVPGSWQHFGAQEMARGEDILKYYQGTRTELGGVLDSASISAVEVVPLLAARASASSGPQLKDVFEAICQELVEHLKTAGKLDGLLLVLHGAMIAETYPDASGEVLRRCREILGFNVPIVATLDLHANVTRQMADMTQGLVGYHTAPHIDLFETGQRGFSLLYGIMRKTINPVVCLKQLPMILPGENGRTTNGPYKYVMDMAIEAMHKSGIVEASVFSVQPWIDVEEVGCSVVVISNGDASLANSEAEMIADEFWRRRAEFEFEIFPLARAIKMALAAEEKPIILSDPSDSPSSGAPGDSPNFLTELIKINPERECLLNIVDPVAVYAMQQAGIGQTLTLQVGARFAPSFYSPATVTGRVRLLCDGDFLIKGPGLHGTIAHRGLTGILQIGAISLLVMERPIFQWDPEMYRSVGLEPRDAQLVQVKSPAAFRAAYESFSAGIILADSPGVCSSNLHSFPFKHIRHPLYPFDDLLDWRH